VVRHHARLGERAAQLRRIDRRLHDGGSAARDRDRDLGHHGGRLRQRPRRRRHRCGHRRRHRRGLRLSERHCGRDGTLHDRQPATIERICADVDDSRPGIARNQRALPENEAQQAQYRTFLTRPLPRAFAIATNGHYASTYTTGPFDKSLPTDPKERALLVCSRLAGVPCELFAVDNQIVFQRPQPALTTKVRSSPGTFPADPALAAAHVPYLNDGQRAEYQVFLTQPPPRAFAISENGHYATAWSNTPSDKSMPSDPRERALAYCRLFSGQECRLFLVNNEIVYRTQ